MLQKIKNYYHLIVTLLAIIWYKSPSSKMTVIGVTGTDGKTTTSSIIYHLLKKLGYKVALISTVSAIIDDKEYDTGFHVSTPDGIRLQSYIRKAADEGITHLVLEVTSHSIDQHRIFGINFLIAVLTNISREHLDYHGSMENYIKTKTKLLNMAGTAILNKDDSFYHEVEKFLTNDSVITYGFQKDADINLQNTYFKTELPGDYNKRNILAALSVISVLGLDMDKSVDSLKSYIPPKGRYDVVYDKKFKVIIDFAHTPGALKELMSSLRVRGRLIHVFGSAGDRDKGKRELMGEVSSQYADYIVLTSEDPRSEDVNEINREVKKGIHKNDIVEIQDRQEAINHGILMARDNDCVLITGKGHENSMNFHGKEVPWSEYRSVEIALALRGESL